MPLALSDPPEHRSAVARWWWVALLVLPVVEVAGSLGVRAGVAEDADWAAAAEVVRAEHREGDVVTVAPAWADPVLRLHLGDLIGLEGAGRADLARYERLWVLSIRGHDAPDQPSASPELEREVGPITVRRWSLGDSPVLYDFVDRVESARVSFTEGGRTEPCPLRRGAPRGGSGLFQPPMAPSARFVCDPRREWLWVGPTVMEDLHLRPRRCIWQHPIGPEPVEITFEDVPLGTHLVLYGGLYYIHERAHHGGVTRVSVRVDGDLVGHMDHHDGDGYKRTVIVTRPPGADGPSTGTVSIATTADNPYHRSMCWSATTRRGPRAEEGP